MSDESLTESERILKRMGNKLSPSQQLQLMKTAQEEREATADYIMMLQEQGHWSEPIFVGGHEIRTENSVELAKRLGYNPDILKHGI